jgi:parallel beta-helix repeat protein
MKKELIGFLICILLISSGVLSVSGTVLVRKTSNPLFNGNILYVGGTGEGNYTKIQDAIDNASDGDIIFVFNGTYQEKTIKIDKAIKLLGEDREITVIDGEYCDGIIVSIKSSDVTIQEFTFRNCHADYFGYALRLFNVSHIIENISIADCIIKNSDRGILYENVVNLIITNCHFHHNPGQVTMGWNSSNIKIRDCVSNNNGKNWGGGWITPGTFEFGEFELGASCSDVEIFNCTLYSNIGFSICFWSGNNIDVYQNQIYRNTWWGIQFYGSTAPLNSIDFHDNHIYKNYETGVHVSDVTNPGIEIHNNNISENGRGLEYWHGGIYLQRCDNCVAIQDNIISSNKGFGIYPKNGHSIIGNDIEKNTEYGIYNPHKEHTSIKDNNIKENKVGIYIGYNSNTISGNIISDNECGIHLSGNSNKIIGNKISNNDDGINIFGHSNKIVRNEISNNNEGIKLYGEYHPLTDNNISYNNFLNNKKDAFFRFSMPSLPITLNYFKRNYWNRQRVLPKPIFGILELLRFDLKIIWIYVDWYPAKTPNDIDQDFDSPIYKNISSNEKNEEYNKIYFEKSISIRNSPPLTRNYRYSIGF